ncbi:unnamed protein product [Closterium sp. NIES-65]|nr:unnamed protein product [Closterium sp. NIES-65]
MNGTGAGMGVSGAGGARVAELLGELAAMEATVSSLQSDVSDSVYLVASIWRITGTTFVLLMQVPPSCSSCRYHPPSTRARPLSCTPHACSLPPVLVRTRALLHSCALPLMLARSRLSRWLGFSLLEAGHVRFKNTRNIMIKNVLDTCVSAIAFWLFGYAVGFGDGTRVFGWANPDGSVAFAGGQNYVQFFYAFAFCATSATIFAGAVAERTHLAAYLLFNFVLAALIYPVIAHVLWSSNGLLSPARGAVILNTNGVLDNAGSMVVHVTGGVTSLVGAWMVGPRIGRFDIDGKVVPFKGHSMVFVAAGTIILWTGFYGFNGCSVDYLGEDPLDWSAEVARVCVNTTICAAAAGVTVWTLTYRRREPVPEDTFNGVIGGLVAACATSSLVEPWAACVIGMGAGALYLLGTWVMLRCQLDDPVQATPVHLVCGSWGGVAVGFFASPANISRTYNIAQPLSCGVFYGCSAWQLLVQILGLLIVYAWVGATALFLFYGLHFFDVLRVKRHQEEVGLDVVFHGGDEADDVEGDQHGHARRFASRRWQQLGLSTLSAVPRGFFSPSRWLRASMRLCSRDGRSSADGEGMSVRKRRDVWHRALDSTGLGQLSLAMYEANYVMEDAVEVEAGSGGVYIGVHDGHGGSETAEFLRHTLYNNLKKEFLRGGGAVSVEALRRGFAETERQFTARVRDSFLDSPHLATVGACSAVAIVTRSALWVANVGDCRAVLGQVRHTGDGLECRALQMSEDHNLSFQAIRDRYREEHADMPDAVTEKRGRYRVKGKITVTRAFGDLYLKSHDFNREPLFSRFRVAEPFNPPLLSTDPHVAVRLLAPHDAFVVVASDGLFELLSNQEVVDMVAVSPRKDIARQLIRAALRRAAERTEVPYGELLRMASGQRRSYHDDITVVVFFFDHDAIRKEAARNQPQWTKDVSLKGGVSVDAAGAVVSDFNVVSSVHGGTAARSLLARSIGSTNNLAAASTLSASLIEDSVLEIE